MDTTFTTHIQTIRNYRPSWARIVSNLLSPPVIWSALAFPITFRYAETESQAILWALTYVVLVCVMPIIFIAWMVWRGEIGDLHMKERHERHKPFLVSLVCTTIAWWILRFMGAPSILPLITLFTLVQLLIMALITLVWQISMHTMSIAGASVAISLVFGVVAALLTVPLIVLVGAARLKLRRHTPMQILVGVLIGALVPTIVLLLL